jgi:hypothetical protein
MLIYLFMLCLIAVITFLVQVQAYSHAHHEISGNDYHDETESLLCPTTDVRFS